VATVKAFVGDQHRHGLGRISIVVDQEGVGHSEKLL
jgi:hypothetical protein